MIQKPMDILKLYPVRKSKVQKAKFRDDLIGYVNGLGYTCRVEKGSFGSRNLVFGNVEEAKYLVTAHYDTCAGMPFPNFLTPCNLWVYLGYQLLIVGAFFLIAFMAGVAFSLFGAGDQLVASAMFACYWVLLLVLMFGPANKNNANDNTSGVVTVLELAAALPEAYRQQVCFVLFDLEEAGTLGSAAFRSKHKKSSDKQLVLNLDCVADGNEIVFFPGKKVKKNVQAMELLALAECQEGPKSIRLQKKGFSMYPSDQANFPYGVGIAAFHRGKHIGLYCSRIHTRKDTILEEENVRLIKEKILHIITYKAV